MFEVISFKPSQLKVIELTKGEFRSKDHNDIQGTGYCIKSLEAALWCFFNTDCFEDAVLRAVNLGDDADTTGAIVGQIAGAYYGVKAIPPSWVERLTRRDEIEAMAIDLFELANEKIPLT